MCLCVSDVCYGRPPPSCQGAVVQLPTRCPSWCVPGYSQTHISRSTLSAYVD